MDAEEAESIRHHDRVTVARDGEEITVHNSINVTPAYQISAANPTKEHFPSATSISPKGYPDGSEPDYVSKECAEELWHELGIDLFDGHDDFDIEVVDLTDDDVVRV